MYKYVGDISLIAQNIIKNYSDNFSIAVDATLGNGHDSNFLSKHFQKVYSFDVQKVACENYLSNQIDNVEVINDSHEYFNKYITGEVDAIMYNLGFLPGNNKDITTKADSTLKSIELGLKILKKGGFMTICVYPGHSEGKVEETCIIEYIKLLPKNEFGVMIHKFENRSQNAPLLVVIEKNS